MNEEREPEKEVDNIFLERWSPRALSGESLSYDELMVLFEAAKWAPSNSNSQPWRFIYAKRDSEYWDKFFGLLVEFNQIWAKNAAVLVVVVSRKTYEEGDNAGKENVTHSFDTGAAWENLALQASMKGLVAHGMAGFDYDKAREVLEIPDEFKVEAMIAIGKKGDLNMIPERMQKGEKKSGRKKLSEIVFEGKFR